VAQSSILESLTHTEIIPSGPLHDQPVTIMQEQENFAGFLIFYSCSFVFLLVFFSLYYTGVSAKTFEPNNSVIFQRIFVKFKMQIL
jgi:hypothetical protein